MTRYEVDLTDEQAEALRVLTDWAEGFRPAVLAPPHEQAAHAYKSVQALAAAVLGKPPKPEPKPERIPEPGIWGVVKAATIPGHTPLHLIRVAQRTHPWTALTSGQGWTWESLIDPILVRPGEGDVP